MVDSIPEHLLVTLNDQEHQTIQVFLHATANYSMAALPGPTFTGDYTGNFARQTYAGNFLGNYDGSIPEHRLVLLHEHRLVTSTNNFTGNFVGNYAANFTRVLDSLYFH